MIQFACNTPFGPLLLEEEDGALVGISPLCDTSCLRALTAADAPPPTPLLQQAQTQLQQYFAGKRQSFTLAIAPRGTPFQKACWAALVTIPYGQTATYGSVAKLVGSPKAARAVGMACNRNPLLFVVPCHRILGAGGRLVGFAAGGTSAKAQLLQMEKTAAPWGQVQQ